MQEEVQSEGEISLFDIFRALWAKAWVILASLLIGAIAGGAFGFVKNHNVHYYGANLTYFVTANKTGESGQINTSNYNETVFVTVTALLSSESFNQELMKDIDEMSDVVFPQSENFTEEDGEKYDEYLKLLDDSLSYSYNYKAGLIKVSVSVLNDEKLAESLMEQLAQNIPEFIANRLKNTASSTGEVTCEQLTYERAKLLNGGQTFSAMIKYAAVVGISALLIACAAIIVIDRTDTRLRNSDDILKKFGQPVLGVIPRIEIPAENEERKKGTEAKR